MLTTSVADDEDEDDEEEEEDEGGERADDDADVLLVEVTLLRVRVDDGVRCGVRPDFGASYVKEKEGDLSVG